MTKASGGVAVSKSPPLTRYCSIRLVTQRAQSSISHMVYPLRSIDPMCPRKLGLKCLDHTPPRPLDGAASVSIALTLAQPLVMV